MNLTIQTLKPSSLFKKRILHKTSILFFSTLCRTNIPFKLIGLINKRTNMLGSIFFCYAGNKWYCQHYCFKFSENMIRWSPTPISIFKQGDKWGIAFASPVTEDSFKKQCNKNNLQTLINRLDKISELLNVDTVNYAGTLPCHLAKNNYLSSDQQNIKPGKIVFKSYKKLSLDKFKQLVPVILLGGSGSVGRYIKDELVSNNIEFYNVDTKNNSYALPESLRGKPCILIDAAIKGALDNYVDSIWKEVIVLNETFPEPGKDLLNKLKTRDISIYHLSGVRGKFFPSLPYGYSSAIPCCAIHSDIINAEPVIVEMLA